MTATLPQLLDQVSALLGRRDLTQTEFSAWFGGAADGGPDGDGLFPLTDSAGYTRMVPSPAKQMATMGNGLDLAGFETLPIATAAEVEAAPPEILGKTADGELRRFTTNMFAARRTQNLSELQAGEYAEQIACLTQTGLERKIAINALQRTVGEIIDPSLPPYNVRFDMQKAKFVYFDANSNHIRCDSAVFSQADIGKIAWVGIAVPTGALVGYIGSVDNDKKGIRLFTNLTFTTPANTFVSGYQEMIWGTDSTAGLQAAFDAAEPYRDNTFNSQQGFGRVVLLTGICGVRYVNFGSIAIVGLSTTLTGPMALPVPYEQRNVPVLADKRTGVYATYRADRYTLKDFSVFGQRFTQNFSSFRNNIDIDGGDFGRFVRGAPYAVIEGIDTVEATWNGFVGTKAFAGQMNNVRAYQNAQAGLRVNFWDLNGQNWHAEGNGWAGVISAMAGGNVSMIRSSFNGTSGSTPETQCNFLEIGAGSTITNLRAQESCGDNVVISSNDPNGVVNNAGVRSTIVFGTLDDTGDTVPATGAGYALGPVRAMVRLIGASVSYNRIEFVTATGQVRAGVNYATNGVWLSGFPSNNTVTINTPGFSNAAADWYAGGGGYAADTAAAARGPFGTSDGAGSISAHDNVITVNGQVAR